MGPGTVNTSPSQKIKPKPHSLAIKVFTIGAKSSLFGLIAKRALFLSRPITLVTPSLTFNKFLYVRSAVLDAVAQIVNS